MRMQVSLLSIACRLAKALNKFEMKATYEDVYQTQHPNVQEYLKHVQQATLLSAIHVSLAADLSVSELCVTQTVHQNAAGPACVQYQIIAPTSAGSSKGCRVRL